MNKPAFRAVVLVAVFLCLVLLQPVASKAGPRIYWHFTIRHLSTFRIPMEWNGHG